LLPELSSMLLDIVDLSTKEAERLVFTAYINLYLDQDYAPRRKGIRETHDKQKALFAESRFRHAFYSKGKHTKDSFSYKRGERVAWIGKVISGEIDGCECWLIPPKGERQSRTPNRLYVLREESYVV